MGTRLLLCNQRGLCVHVWSCNIHILLPPHLLTRLNKSVLNVYAYMKQYNLCVCVCAYVCVYINTRAQTCLFVNSEKFVYKYCMGIKLLHVHTRTCMQNCFEQVFRQKRFMVTGLILPFWCACVRMCTRGIAFKYAHVCVVMEYVFCVRA